MFSYEKVGEEQKYNKYSTRYYLVTLSTHHKLLLTSILPLHLSTNRSILISNNSESLKGRCVITTPLLNSSKGLRLSAVRLPFDNFTKEPHRSWKRILSGLRFSSGKLTLELYYLFFYSHNLFLVFIVMYLTFISIRMSRLLLLLRLSSLKSPPNVTFKTSFSMAKTELPLRQSSLLCSRNVGLVMLTCTHFP